MSIKVVLVDDHAVVRQGFRALIERQPDMEVVGEAGDGRTALQLCRDLFPDVVVMDVTMPDLNGIDATRRLKADSPDTKILGLSMHSSRRFVTGMFQAGASGYLPKESVFDDLILAIRTILSGQTFLSPKVAGAVVDDYLHRLPGTDGSGTELTGREREVLQLLAEGHSTKEIAIKLEISGKAIEAHRRHLMVKLSLDGVAELTKYALREGLTTLDV